MIVATQMFSTMTELETLIKERALFVHEHSSGYYRTSTFFLTKVLWDILLVRSLVSIIFSMIVYFMTGLDRNVNKFFIFLLTVFFSSLFGSTVCLFVAATASHYGVALILVILIYLVMMVFSGFIIALKSMFDWLSWIHWLSAFRYASNMLAMSEFRNLTFCLANDTHICPLTGLEVLHEKDMNFTTKWDLWKNYVVLLIMTVVFLILTHAQLLRIKKTN
ncbi:unnamed protein product [Rotaria sordida]|nr:unnamed protein product [Rotaria sordida]CAF1539486.1 unnamed protein product [Rotaria sordida]